MARPASVLPTFTTTIGVPCPAAASAAARSVLPVAKTLDVGGDRADFGLGGEPGGEVGELEVGLVAGGRPVREPDADFLRLEDGPALMPALRDERDRRPVEIVAETSGTR